MKSCRHGIILASIALAVRAAPMRAAAPLPPLKPGEHIENFYGYHYLTQHGWKMPYPPYPGKARYLREQGKVYLQMVTDQTGRVVKTTVLRTPLNTSSKTLRQMVVLWTLYKWSGPPNTTANIEFEFRLR